MAKKATAKTATKRFRRLLAKGYFAPELPPCFVSERFAERRKAIWALIEKTKIPKQDGNGFTNKPAYKSYISKTSWFNYPRFGRSDRRHGVVNPIAYISIAKVISDNFVKIRSRSNSISSISVSPLVFDWSGTRAILRPNVDLLEDFRIELSSRREQYVSADLRAFYHSVYTHSISWAMRGKNKAKAGRFDSHFSNDLDILCRNAQHGQTIGLPVGPDTSRIIAELIASAVDSELISDVNLTPRDASRYVDDYTLSSADGFTPASLTAALRRAAGVYELELNQDKTTVVSTAKASASGWKQAALAHRPDREHYSPDEFKRFFYELGRVRDEHPEINVERWTLMNARSAFLACDYESWKIVLRNLINAYRRNSTLISLFCELIILRNQKYPDEVYIESVSEFLENRIPVLSLEDRTGEIIWLLFLILAVRIKVNAKNFERLSTLDEPMCALLLRKAKSEKLIVGKLDTTTWDAHVNADGLDGGMWLYAYEAARLGLVNEGTQHISEHRHFSALLKHDVGFLSIEDGVAAVLEAEGGRRTDNRHQAKLRHAFDDHTVAKWFLSDELDEDDDENDDDDDAVNWRELY